VVSRLSGVAAREAKKLQAELDRYADARPARLARHVSAKGGQKKAAKGNNQE
jgi:hypothetical protein